jgi:hypothetical protein
MNVAMTSKQMITGMQFHVSHAPECVGIATLQVLPRTQAPRRLVGERGAILRRNPLGVLVQSSGFDFVMSASSKPVGEVSLSLFVPDKCPYPNLRAEPIQDPGGGGKHASNPGLVSPLMDVRLGETQ